MIILAVDPGQKRIGLAITDPTGKVAFPLMILEHKNRREDARQIVQIATENNVELIIVGQALNADDQPTLQSR
ncbi:MAG: RuvX/YqgF family protein, partial [Anaerolineales bacterium]